MFDNFSKKTQRRDGKPKNEKDHLEHIPFKLREIMKSKDKMKNGSLGSKKLRKGEQTPMKHCFWLELLTNLVYCFSVFLASSSHLKLYNASDADLPVLQFNRNLHESDGAYVRRMEDETKYVLFLSKNQVDRKPELEADKQEKPAGKEKSEKKKEWVHSDSFVVVSHWMPNLGSNLQPQNYKTPTSMSWIVMLT